MLINIIEPIAPDNYVAFTFFTGYIAMLAASVFFFVERGSVDEKWKMSLLVSALITGIAAVHYWYMRDYWANFGESPTFFRYVDWVLTVPLMCVEFYLILRIGRCEKKSSLETHSSIYMDVGVWIHRRSIQPRRIKCRKSFLHNGVCSLLGYLYILYDSSVW